MLSPREYRLQECENVRGLLHDTLRYAYSSKSSRDVYAECLERLQLIEDAFEILEDDEEDELQELSNQLSQLSELIGRVERSRIEEFSWPFAAALQDLAVKICQSGLESTDSPPLFFISADDELNSYSIITEQSTPGISSVSLFNIIFPRSLKHFVLLHPILGHELGHAAVAAPHHAAGIRTNVIDVLTSRSPLHDITRFEQWLQRIGADLDLDQRTQASWSWPEELYCDVFGLLLMGPSYIGANSSLLRPFKSYSSSDSHPPSATRYWALDRAVCHLGWRDHLMAGRTIRKSAAKYFDSLTEIAADVPRKYRLLQESQIVAAVENLRDFLRPIPDALFSMPSAETLSSMRGRMLEACPPVASHVSRSGQVSNESVDFRAILLAGWLTWVSDERSADELTFMKLNLLCQQGILQQSSIDIWARYGREHPHERA